MTAMEEYRSVCAVVRSKEYWALDRSQVADAADAAIAELEAENERLKVCGNCEEWRLEGGRCYAGDDGTVFTKRLYSCRFAPPRWAENR